MADKEVTESCVQTQSGGKKDKKSRKNFRWDEELIEDLLSSIIDYKTQMSMVCKDFDADKPKLYTDIRIALAKLHPQVFGPVDESELTNLSKEEAKKVSKAEKELISKGRSRIIEKIKEIRQSFSKAVISGTRSGSGRIVYEHYDKLVEIWGGLTQH